MATGAWWHRVLAEAGGGWHGLPGAGADQASAADGRPHPLTGTSICLLLRFYAAGASGVLLVLGLRAWRKITPVFHGACLLQACWL